MKVELFRALQSIKISDAIASDVVKAMEDFMKSKMEEATAPLRAELNAIKWMIGIFGVFLSVASVATGFIVSVK